jgi:two-component system sensor histidine kinase BaeS
MRGHDWVARRRGRGGQPPWWPDGEPWPPTRPPWAHRAPWLRRRIGVVLLLAVAALIGIGIAIGAAFQHSDSGRRGSFLAPLVVVAIAVVVATAIASRRLARPVRRLLDSAERIGEGDYDTRVTPQGPPEVRQLMETFNAMAEQLETTDAERRRFLADVTHELRTPLAILQSGIEAQLDDIHPRDDAHLASLLDEARRLGTLVDDLHTLSLLGAGRLALHMEPTDPAALIEDAVDATAAIANAKLLTVTIDTAPDLPALEIDPHRIRQVLDNLLANALRHTPADGRITVSAHRIDPQLVAFAVADTGPGIEPERLPRVFDRFETSDDRAGSGLGLAIARDLVRAHGGTVDIDASARGTTVTFTLPTSGR